MITIRVFPFMANGKRDVQVAVRMTESDMTLLKRAATKLWPRAILSNSAIVLGLARIAAEDALKKR